MFPDLLLIPTKRIINHNNLQRVSEGKMTRICNFALFLLFLFVTSPGLASNPEPLVRVLPNGLTVILQENQAAPVVSIQAWVQTGSIREQAEEEGMAHVLEHLLFKGTESRGLGVIAKEVESSGGEINAYTSWDTTVYYINMASRFMDKGIDILADIMQSASFDPQELVKEKIVVLEEIRRSKDIPGRKLNQAFFGEAYDIHPYRRPVIGSEETVRAFTRDQIIAFYRKWYVPGNIIWVVAGDLDPETLLPKLENRLSKLTVRPVPVKTEVLEPPQTATKIFTLEEDVKQTYLRIGFHIPDVANPDVPALDLLAQILGQGKSSRLYQDFRMKNRLVNSISAYSLTPKDPGLFVVGASLEPKDMEKVLPDILKKVLQSGFEPVRAEELKTAKVQIESDFIYQQETVQGQARELGYYQNTMGDLDFGKQYLEQISATRAADVQLVARQYLRPDNMTIGILAPQTAEDKVQGKKLEKIARKVYQKLESSQAAKESAEGQQQGMTAKIRLKNGATLLIKANPAIPLVSINAVFLGGLLSENKQTDGISNFTATMLSKGTSSRTAKQIAQEIEALAGSVSGFSGRNSFGLTSEVVSWNLPAAFEIFSDILLHPSFPEEHIEKTRQDILAAIKNQKDSLSRIAFKLFWKSLYPCHPYGMDALGTPETVQKFGREDLFAFYQQEAVAPNLVLSVVGAVNEKEVREMVEKSLDAMPATPFKLPVFHCETEPLHLAEELVSPDKLQAHIIVGARGASYKDADRFSLDVLQAILSGQGGRLFVELRDRQSLAYTVAAFNQEAYDPGAFGIYMATKADNYEKAIQGIRDQLKTIREEKVSSEELERAKNYIVGAHALGIQTNSAQASLMAAYERYGLGYDSYLAYPDHILKVTARQVRKAAKKYLCADCLVEAVVMPEGNENNLPEKSEGEEKKKLPKDERHQ